MSLLDNLAKIQWLKDLKLSLVATKCSPASAWNMAHISQFFLTAFVTPKGGSVVKKKKKERKNSPANVGDLDLIPWRRKWQPTPVFCLENPKDRGAWQATVYGVTKSRHNLPTKQQQKPAFL